MVWAYVGTAVALGCLAAWWLGRRRYRRDDDVLHRTVSPWWIPVVTGLGAIVASPFFAGQPAVVIVTYLLALVWAAMLAFIDLDVRRLPDRLVLPAYAAVAALLTVCSAVTGNWEALLRAAACAGIAIVIFLIAALVSPDAQGLGLGDVKLAGVLGALLGWLSWLTAALGLLSGFILGGFLALILLLARRVDRKSTISFGPPMLLGAYVWCLLTIPG
jgi:leader peptidase (prepilin peptidase) / N-methyltransferase